MKTYIVREDIEEWRPLIDWLDVPPNPRKTEAASPAAAAPAGVG